MSAELAADLRRFEDEGYLVVRGLLDARGDVDPVTRAYDALIEALCAVYESGLERPQLTAREDTSAGERLAFALGASGGEVLWHLAPVLSVFSPTFRWRSDLPSAQLPELFRLMRNPRLLDRVEALIGPEIYASPIYHLTMKLPRRHLELAERIAKQAGRARPRQAIHYGFEVGQTPWHMDAITGLRDSHDSKIVIAWIPLSTTDRLLGSLLLIPRSHRNGVQGGPYADELTRQAIEIEAAPGDVVFMDNKLVHGSSENRSDDGVRWACNLRYLPIGQPDGRPYLPGFVARSRSAPQLELANPYLWMTIWMRALENVSAHEFPVPSVATHRRRAEAITWRWRETVPDVRGWLRLGEHAPPGVSTRIARQLAAGVGRWLGSAARR